MTHTTPAITAHMYGIRNCATVKKALDWCAAHALEVVFHDYKKEAPTAAQLQAWCARLGWQALINRRGTTWRRLPAERQLIDTQEQAILLMLDQPSLIKRPLLRLDDRLLLGFVAADYEELWATLRARQGTS